MSNPFSDELKLFKEQCVVPSPEAGFAAYIFGHKHLLAPNNVVERTIAFGNDHDCSFPSVSFVGYSNYLKYTKGDAVTSIGWIESLKKLSLRELFPADRQSIAYRPTELLGVCLGLVSTPNEEIKNSFALPILQRRISDCGISKEKNLWAWLLYCHAGSVLGLNLKNRFEFVLEKSLPEEIFLCHWMLNNDQNLSNAIGLTLQKTALLKEVKNRFIEGSLHSNSLEAIAIATYVYFEKEEFNAEPLASRENKTTKTTIFLKGSFVMYLAGGVSILTLAYFMLLGVLSVFGFEVPSGSKSLLAVIGSFGIALSFSLIGGKVAAKGQIPIPWVRDNPVVFTATGGFAAFLISLVLLSYIFK